MRGEDDEVVGSSGRLIVVVVWTAERPESSIEIPTRRRPWCSQDVRSAGLLVRSLARLHWGQGCCRMPAPTSCPVTVGVANGDRRLASWDALSWPLFESGSRCGKLLRSRQPTDK